MSAEAAAPASVRLSRCSQRRWRTRRTKYRVTETQHQKVTLIELYVSPRDIARVLGRSGRTAAALRTLAATAGEKDGKQVTLEIRESR